MARNRFRGNAPETHRDSNFERRLRTTTDSESDPESYTPMTAGVEELPEYAEKFPLVRNLRSSNRMSRRGPDHADGDNQRRGRSES